MIVSMNNLLESGVHYGHQKRRWNPKMKEYIYTSRDDIYILNLQKTEEKLQNAYNALKEIAENGGKVLFVGTKRQAQEAVETHAKRSESFYATNRWLGGTLTNFRTIKSRIGKMEEIEKQEEDGVFEMLPKKEVLKIRREYEKLDKNLSGIRNMEKLPAAIVIVDPIQEATAIKEARSLNIPVFGIIDTNGDPDLLDYPIPGNDDAIKSINLLIGVLANAICEATGKETIDYVGEIDSDHEVITQEEYMNRKQREPRKDRGYRRDNKFGFRKNNNFRKNSNEKENDKVEQVQKEEVKEEKNEVKKEEKVEVKETKEVKEKEVKETKKEEVKKEEKKETKKSKKEDLNDKTLVELKEMAKEKGLKGYSTMKKQELIDELNK